MKIPFVEYLGIEQEEDSLILEPKKELENHIGTIHASAQFTLAETASGMFLLKEFPDMEAVIPLLRSSSVKYKAPATSKLSAKATLTQDEKERFLHQFTKKGRATICVKVEIMDIKGVVTMIGEFHWFIQKSI